MLLSCFKKLLVDTSELSSILLLVCVANSREVPGKNEFAETDPPSHTRVEAVGAKDFNLQRQ